MDTLHSLQEYTLIPSIVSNINSRSECSPFDNNGYLPLFVSPMTSVINLDNWRKYNELKLNTIIPRNVDLDTRLRLSAETWAALSLDEFIDLFADKEVRFNFTCKILIDIADGHMAKLINACKTAKEIHGDRIILMAGNVANPKTYFEYAKAGIDYIRVGIGGGSACLTADTGIFYPMGSLIEEIHAYKKWVESRVQTYKSVPKIVADGGFKTNADIIKALALGADYVMLGSVLAKSDLACGKLFVKERNDRFTDFDIKFLIESEGVDMEKSEFFDMKFEKKQLYREYYGMSTKRAQKEFGKDGTKVEEGISKKLLIEYRLTDWITTFENRLRSAMSYTNSKSIDEFIGDVEYQLVSSEAIRFK